MSCGPACCRQLLLEGGIDVAEAELRVIAKYSASIGSLAWDLADALNVVLGANRYTGGGVDPVALPGLMARTPFLALLWFQSAHWVIVDGQQGRHVLLRDPAGTPEDLIVGAEVAMRREEFDARWRRGGYGVVFRK